MLQFNGGEWWNHYERIIIPGTGEEVPEITVSLQSPAQGIRYQVQPGFDPYETMRTVRLCGRLFEFIANRVAGQNNCFHFQSLSTRWLSGIITHSPGVSRVYFAWSKGG